MKNFKGLIFEGYYSKKNNLEKNFRIKDYSHRIIPYLHLGLRFLMPIFNNVFFNLLGPSTKNKNITPFDFHFPQYKFNILSTILGFKKKWYFTHDILINKKYLFDYLSQIKNSVGKNYIYLCVIKKLNDNKNYISFSGSGVSILICVKYKKEIMKSLYKLDKKYKVIVNLYSNPMHSRKKLIDYYGYNFLKFSNEIKKYVKENNIKTILSGKI